MKKKRGPSPGAGRMVAGVLNYNTQITVRYKI